MRRWSVGTRRTSSAGCSLADRPRTGRSRYTNVLVAQRTCPTISAPAGHGRGSRSGWSLTSSQSPHRSLRTRLTTSSSSARTANMRSERRRRCAPVDQNRAAVAQRGFHGLPPYAHDGALRGIESMSIEPHPMHRDAADPSRFIEERAASTCRLNLVAVDPAYAGAVPGFRRPRQIGGTALLPVPGLHSADRTPVPAQGSWTFRFKNDDGYTESWTIILEGSSFRWQDRHRPGVVYEPLALPRSTRPTGTSSCT